MEQRGIGELSEGKFIICHAYRLALQCSFLKKKNYQSLCNVLAHIEELELLDRGGQMWESGSTKKENKKGLLGDIFNVLKAFSGGAHITKNEYGET